MSKIFKVWISFTVLAEKKCNQNSNNFPLHMTNCVNIKVSKRQEKIMVAMFKRVLIEAIRKSFLVIIKPYLNVYQWIIYWTLKEAKKTHILIVGHNYKKIQTIAKPLLFTNHKTHFNHSLKHNTDISFKNPFRKCNCSVMLKLPPLVF